MSRGARCRALVGGLGQRLLVPYEEQPPAPGSQLGLPPCCWPPPLSAACCRHLSFSPLRPPPACLPARPPPALGPGAREGKNEGGREAGRRAGRRKGGRQRERETGGRGIGGGGDCIGRGWGTREENADEEKALHWTEGPPLRATSSTTPCHRPAQAALGHRSQGDERLGDLKKARLLVGEGYGDEETCRGTARQLSRPTEVRQDPQNPQGQGQGKSLEKRKEGPLKQGSRPQRQAKDLGDRAAVDPESPCEDGDRPMRTESLPPLAWEHGSGPW